MNEEPLTAQREGRCVELTLSGHSCALKPVAGRDRCYIHGLFRELNDGRRTIDIPLLEDEASILYTYSQVARAMAQGAMPAANGNAIIRCCSGAQKMLAEKRKHERFLEKQRLANKPPSAQPEPGQPVAVVPANLEDPATADAAPANQDAAEEANTLQLVSSSETAEEPQPWTLPPDRTIVPPPQFAGARQKFDDILASSEGLKTTAVLQRNKEIRARGGSYEDIVITDIRSTF